MSYSSLVTTVALVCLVGCDGQQYVSPDTVALVVTDTASGVERVNHCHYVPVLLGSEIEARYVVKGELGVTIRLTRDDVRVDYAEPGQVYASYQVETEQLEGTVSLTDEGAPDGYRVELSSPCTPKTP
jgi:hypothetical protein